MFILDSLLIGSLRFVLEKLAAAAEAESQDDSTLREQLLEAQMRLELGDINDDEYAEVERQVLARLRDIKHGRRAGLASSDDGVKVTGVEAIVADELNE